MERPVFHIILHVLIPLAIAWIAYRQEWKKAWLLMMLSLLIDADHLLATPVYAPNRCSIGFHPLHTFYAMPAYAMLTAIPKTRLIGLGLVLHILLDQIDCIWMGG